MEGHTAFRSLPVCPRMNLVFLWESHVIFLPDTHPPPLCKGALYTLQEITSPQLSIQVVPGIDTQVRPGPLDQPVSCD